MFQFYLSSIKRKELLAEASIKIKFQFYLSSIKSSFGETDWDMIAKFQFYLSSIKRRKRTVTQIGVNNVSILP